MVPEEGSVVTAKVVNVNPRFCRCAIVGVERTQLTQSFRGMIRKEDIRATEKDKIEVYKSFRPGDVVLARILSLGDAQSYLLSTAENELGVVLAQSEAGKVLLCKVLRAYNKWRLCGNARCGWHSCICLYIPRTISPPPTPKVAIQA